MSGIGPINVLIMTRAVRDRILKDANGDIGDHLRNHIHLTNCIHLKNHMHKHSPILADRSLMKDLVVLQRSRSLRDPSASPPSWNSPSIVDMLSKRIEKDAVVREGRRSVGNEHRRDCRRFPRSSPPAGSHATSKVAPDEETRGISGVVPHTDRSSKSGGQDGRRAKREESSRKSIGTDRMGGNEVPPQVHGGNEQDLEFVSGNPELKGKKNKHKGGKHSQDPGVQIKTLSEQLNEVPMDINNVASSHIHFRGRLNGQEKNCEDPETSIRGYCSGLNRVKRRKFKSARRNRASVALRDIGAQNELSVASNSFAEASGRPNYHMGEGEKDYADQNVTRAPGNGCGIPWNWSRIHDRGKTFLDLAGRSLSCGLSDPRLKKGGPIPQGRDVSGMPIASDHSSSATKSDAEALPLLVEVSGSQGSTENAAWVHDYSGELGIFADHLLKQDIDSDLVSEARCAVQRKFSGNCRGGHQTLTQKYMPRTFRDLVGQNLVAQALSNAVLRRKVGLLYLFYGPHGTGKTSCARIFARALNCQCPEEPKPCGFCKSCIAHDMGKSRNIREIGPVSNFDFESIMDLLDNMIVSQLPSQYRVFIFDECDTLSPDCWSAISKVIDRAPRRVVFVLVSSSLDVLPHIIISRCQKFFFPKLKDADIIYTLQLIATKEDLEIDKDALKLIASRSDGSLRDAEMTLEQLSLLGQRISVHLVQELVGLISDEKLVHLLDLALSADTVNTVKNLREVMETGVEPLALMSQLATVITDILAGSFDFTKDRVRRKFFRRQALSKEDMEKLRQALRTLSEAEKQLRMSNDKLTWLTAALLQLAPDQQYMLPGSSADTSFIHSPLVSNTFGQDMHIRGNVEHAEMLNYDRGLSRDGKLERHGGTSVDVNDNSRVKASSIDIKKHAGAGFVPQETSSLSADMHRNSGRQVSGKHCKGIWSEVLEKIQVNSIKEFMYQEGKLIFVSLGAAPTVQLMFSSHLTKSKAERFRAYILQAFESVLGSPVTIEIRCDSKNGVRAGTHVPLILSASENGPSQIVTNPEYISDNRSMAGYDDISKRVPKDRDVNGFGSMQHQLLHTDSREIGRSEIVELGVSPRDPKFNEQFGNNTHTDKRSLESIRTGEAASSHDKFTIASRRMGEQIQSQSLVRSKVSLAHVIQQAEGCTQRNGWSKRKAVSIAEKLEQENLRLEPRSRSLLCWKASRATRRKLSRLKIRTRKPKSLLKLVSCGKCLTVKSPR